MKKKHATSSTGHGTGVTPPVELHSTLQKHKWAKRQKKAARARGRLARHRGTDRDQIMEKLGMLK